MKEQEESPVEWFSGDITVSGMCHYSLKGSVEVFDYLKELGGVLTL